MTKHECLGTSNDVACVGINKKWLISSSTSIGIHACTTT